VWVSDSTKVGIIDVFLETNNELIDIRQEYTVLKTIDKEIDEEPSIVEIGCLEINLGD